MKPIKKVIIKDEKYEDGYSELVAKNSEKGELVKEENVIEVEIVDYHKG